MIAEVIAIGTELTCGAKLDTNSQWLSRELEALGWTVGRHTQLPDDTEQIALELQAAVCRARAVIITGGLGPTLDDVTRDALALAFSQPLVMDPDSLQRIQALFAARGREMPERNTRQALRPQFAQAIPNSCGTAPGILMRIPHQSNSGKEPASDLGTLIAVLPGVPAEMKPMFVEQVAPLLSSTGMAVHRCVIRTFGHGESDAERLLGDLTARGRNPEVGITASEAVISLWVTARAATSSESVAMGELVRQEILQRLGQTVFAEGDRDLHDVVAELLTAAGQQVAFIEGPTTGGLLSQWFTEEPVYAERMSSGRVYSSMRQLVGTESSPEEWETAAKKVAADIIARGQTQYVLLSSPCFDQTTAEGVALRRGWVAIAASDFFEVADVSMSGNLSIFRHRAARTALNRLRLRLSKPDTATGIASPL